MRRLIASLIGFIGNCLGSLLLLATRPFKRPARLVARLSSPRCCDLKLDRVRSGIQHIPLRLIGIAPYRCTRCLEICYRWANPRMIRRTPEYLRCYADDLPIESVHEPNFASSDQIAVTDQMNADMADSLNVPMAVVQRVR